jgi:hypothetical protein
LEVTVKNPVVTFHEYARAFTWNIVSREVRDADGYLVTKSAFNIKQARSAAKQSIRR